jgi:plasmid stability protein
MAQLIVRKVAPEVVAALRRRAASKGRSMEAEHRAVLCEALVPAGPSLKQMLLEMPDAGKDSDFERIRQRPRRVRL